MPKNHCDSKFRLIQIIYLKELEKNKYSDKYSKGQMFNVLIDICPQGQMS